MNIKITIALHKEIKLQFARFGSVKYLLILGVFKTLYFKVLNWCPYFNATIVNE